MTTVDGYNSDFWKKRIGQYLEDDWSQVPTPFAQKAVTYFPFAAKILELGAGAGQDGLWFAEHSHTVKLTDATDAAFIEIDSRVHKAKLKPDSIHLQTLDLFEPLPFTDASYDVVYAQLVLHYFDDDQMQAIMSEIRRVLKPRGIFAALLNSTDDPEYDQNKLNAQGLLDFGDINKRYFSVESFKPFVTGFEPQLLDNQGTTPKDSKKNIYSMIQFIGSKV